MRITSIGMNHAELMGRRGQYKLSTGEPPFTPGLEGGGIIDAIGAGVSVVRVGDRVCLAPHITRAGSLGGRGGGYCTHYLCGADEVLICPKAIPDEQLGALWLSHLTAWGCLVWKQQVKPGQTVAVPACSSSVGLAAAQVAKDAGCNVIGLTTSADKVQAIQALDNAPFDHLIVTHNPDRTMKPWHKDMRSCTDSGVDVFFDPVAAGEYLNTEIKCLAQGGTIWVYGLLGEPGVVDVTPLIRKDAAIRGFVNGQILKAGEPVWREACAQILQRFDDGRFSQTVARMFPLSAVQNAHQKMEQGKHIGKLILIP